MCFLSVCAQLSRSSQEAISALKHPHTSHPSSTQDSPRGKQTPLCTSAVLRRGRMWIPKQGATGHGTVWQLSLTRIWGGSDCLKVWDGAIRTRKTEWVGKEIQSLLLPLCLGPGYGFQFPTLGLTGQGNHMGTHVLLSCKNRSWDLLQVELCPRKRC